MKSSIRMIALSAFVPVFAFAAQVQGEGPGAVDIGAPVLSQASVQYVKSQVARPVNMVEGSAHVTGPLDSGLSRDEVKAQALVAARAGGAGQGEMPTM